VIALTLAEVASAVGGRLRGGARPDTVVTGAVRTDSRAVGAGDLFVAIAGESHDGHAFASLATGAGAVAVLAERELDVACVVVDDTVEALGRLARHVLDRLDGLVVVAVTGSSGKTGTKDLLAQLLPAYGPTVAPAGNLNNEIGLPMTALQVDPSTRVLVAEMGARGVGHVRYLTGITPPRIGVVLNVGSAHVGEFGSRELVARAKAELVEALPHASAGGVAVLNADDPLVLAMRELTGARVVTFGESPDADVRAVTVGLDDHGRPSFQLVSGGREATETMRLHGRHQVSNALAVAAVGLSLGLDLAEVASGLSEATPASRWRMEVTETPSGVTVVNDAYNANPESVRAALEALTAMARATPTRPARRSVAVLGVMRELGDHAVIEHEEIGRTAVRLGVDRLVLVGAGIEVSALHEGALSEAGRGPTAATTSSVVRDVPAAVALLRDELRAGDVVLVKASRSAGLERVATALIQRGGAVR
jgi:UDP-N-acetylmuramoyl-tripeptide--D-alanyl-D-alanine ligase